MANTNADATALIIAGGRGTRFWPLSRSDRPKPLFSLDGRTTLLDNTIARLEPLIPRDRIFVIVAADQAAAFRRALQGRLPARNLLIEPEGRGTTLAITLGAAIVRRRLGESTLAVIPADHHVTPQSGFRRTLTAALGLARSRDAIVVVGVKPTRAETGYGYQKVGRPVGSGFVVERFIEKPPKALAAQMIRSSRYLWNAGMFVMSTRTLSEELATHCPPLAAALPALATLKGTALKRAYRRQNLDAFDRDVVEKSERVLSVKARFEWHDVGSWQGLWEAMRGRGDNVTTGPVVALESHGVVARAADSRLMVIAGMDDLVAIDAGDAILIARRSQSQDLRRVTNELRRRGLDRFL
jgi:mannose-1-phosphate guanylyltransferase